MTLQISRDKKTTYTYKEILEDRYPELYYGTNLLKRRC